MNRMRDLFRRNECGCCKPTCRDCAELTAIVEAIHDDFAQLTRQARVPTAEIVWWRAQMRARQEAARTAARPIVFSQAIALAALLGLLGSVAGRLTLPDIAWTTVSPLWGNFPFLALALAACSLLIIPLAVYFALAE